MRNVNIEYYSARSKKNCFRGRGGGGPLFPRELCADCIGMKFQVESAVRCYRGRRSFTPPGRAGEGGGRERGERVNSSCPDGKLARDFGVMTDH